MSNTYEATNWWEMVPSALLAAIATFCRCIFAVPPRVVVIACLIYIILMPNKLKTTTISAPPMAQPALSPGLSRPVILKYSPFVRTGGR